MKQCLRPLAVVFLTLGFAVGLILHGGFRHASDADAAQRAAVSLDDPILLDVRGVYDDQRIALAFTWTSNKPHPGILHDIRGYNAEKQSWDRPRAMNEDRISFMLEDPAAPVVDFRTMGCYVTCHSDLNNMPENTVDTRHYIDKSTPGQGRLLDMWHWRGARSGPMGYAEDTWVRAHEFGTGAQGRRRDDSAGFTTTTLREDGDRLREDMPFAFEVAHGDQTLLLPEYVFDPERNSGFFFLNDGTDLILTGDAGRLWEVLSLDAMEAGRLQHALIATGPLANALHVPSLSPEQTASLVSQVRDGVLIPRPVLFDYPSDQHDIQAQRAFDTSTRTWTVTMIRDLDTGSANDVSLTDLPGRQTYALGIAIHDSNDSRESHQVSVPLTMGAQGTNADIILARVNTVNAVDWSGIASLQTLTYKPGATTLQHLRWVHEPVGANMSAMRCQRCHTEQELADISAHNMFTSSRWISTFYIAYMGRAGDPAGLNFWLREVARGATSVPGVAENFALSDEAKAMYPYFKSPETATDAERTSFVLAVYQNLMNRNVPANDEGVLYWVGELRTGRTTPGMVIGNMVHAAIQLKGKDWLTIWNKVQVSEYFSKRFEISGRAWQNSDLDLTRQALLNVTDDPATVQTAKARVDQMLL